MPVGLGRLSVRSGRGLDECRPKIVRVVRGETKRGEDPCFVFAAGVFRVQAVVRELSLIDDGGVATRQFHRAAGCDSGIKVVSHSPGTPCRVRRRGAR